MFKFALQGIYQKDFPMLCRCKDYKNVTKDKKLCQSRFLFDFQALQVLL